MNPDDLIDELEAMMQDITPYERSKIQKIIGAEPAQTDTTTGPVSQPGGALEKAPTDVFAQKRAQGAAAAQAAMTDVPAKVKPVEPEKGSPEYFAQKRAQGAAAAQAAATDVSKPTPQKFGSRGIPGLGESKFYSKFLDKTI